MSKRTLAAILAVGIAGGAIAVSQLPSVKNFDLSSRITNIRPVALGRTVSKAELEAALSSAAKELGYSINVNDVYKKGYELGSGRETSTYRWTDANLRKGFFQHGLEVTFYCPDVTHSFSIRPEGFGSEEEIKQYLSAVSNYLSEQ